jgi:hypothetical protein
MTNSTFQIDYKDLNINVSQIEEILGYNEGEDREIFKVLIEEVLKETESFCQIRAEYNICTDLVFNNAEKSVDINGINFQIKKIVFDQLKNTDSVAVFLCTAGEELGIRTRKAMKDGDLLTGYIYDVAGSVIVDAAADFMQNELELSVNLSGKKITNRYSPGYCGWYVAEQHKLFQLVPDNYCGIRLTESALMDPVKSISGIIGIGANVKMNPYTCGLCEMKNCVYRKKKEIRDKSATV